MTAAALWSRLERRKDGRTRRTLFIPAPFVISAEQHHRKEDKRRSKVWYNGARICDLSMDIFHCGLMVIFRPIQRDSFAKSTSVANPSTTCSSSTVPTRASTVGFSAVGCIRGCFHTKVTGTAPLAAPSSVDDVFCDNFCLRFLLRAKAKSPGTKIRSARLTHPGRNSYLLVLMFRLIRLTYFDTCPGNEAFWPRIVRRRHLIPFKTATRDTTQMGSRSGGLARLHKGMERE